MIILAYLFFFIAASASPLQRRHLARSNRASGQVAFAAQVMMVVVLLSLVLPFIWRPELDKLSLHILMPILITGICGAGYLALQYVAQKHVEAGLTSLTGNIYTPTTIVLATIFLGESLRPIQAIGTTILICGIIIASTKNFSFKKRQIDRYFLMMILQGIILGGALTAERMLIKDLGFSLGSIISWSSQLLFLLIMAYFTKNKSTYKFKDIGLTGVLRFLQLLSFVLLVNLVGNLSVVSAITTFKVVIIVIAGAVLFGEKNHFIRKFTGSIIACAGLLLLG